MAKRRRSSRPKVSLNVQQKQQDHLPRIELPKLSGSSSECPAFSSLFETRVEGFGEDADRYAFLTKCLEWCDITRHSCESFENDCMPFVHACAKLEERFYRKQKAFSGHIRRIPDFPPITFVTTITSALKIPPPLMDTGNLEGFFLAVEYWFAASGITAVHYTM